MSSKPTEIYRREYRVSVSDVDPRRELRLSALFRLFQEAATEHAALLGAGTHATLDRGLLWVVTTQQAQMTRMPRYEEDIVLTSWPGKPTHAFFPRYYMVKTRAGEPLVSGSALWVLMDAQSRKMILPRDGLSGLEGTVTGEEPDLPAPPKLGELTDEGVFTVPPSYLDLNGHMNNIRYFDLAEDFLPPFPETDGLRRATIKYGSEVRAGEKLTLRWGGEEKARFLLGEAAGKKVFRLRIEYEPREAGVNKEKGGGVK